MIQTPINTLLTQTLFKTHTDQRRALKIFTHSSYTTHNTAPASPPTSHAADLHNPAPTHHIDRIRPPDHREPVRHDERRHGLRDLVNRFLVDRLLNDRLGLVVEVARRLVQHQDLRLTDEGAGDRNPLFLATRELQALLLW